MIMCDYLLGGLIGASIALLGTVAVARHIDAQPVHVEVTLVGEPVEAPESPVEAPEPEKVLGLPEEPEKVVVPRAARRRHRNSPKLDINLESDDPLEGI